MFDKDVFNLPLIGFGTGMVFVILVLWVIFWKGLALWVVAREQKKIWFIFLLILNTAGLLEIVYLAFFSQTGKNYLARFKKNKIQKNDNACDCASCNGCECACHKPIE